MNSKLAVESSTSGDGKDVVSSSATTSAEIALLSCFFYKVIDCLGTHMLEMMTLKLVASSRQTSPSCLRFRLYGVLVVYSKQGLALQVFQGTCTMYNLTSQGPYIYIHIHFSITYDNYMIRI